MKRYSTSCIVRELEIKTTVKCHRSLRYIELKRLRTPNTGKFVEQLKLSCNTDENTNTLKNSLLVSYIVKHFPIP